MASDKELERLKRQVAALSVRVEELEEARGIDPKRAPEPEPGAEPEPEKPTERPRPKPRKEFSGNILGWIGGIVLALGCIFLVTYAFQQGWVSKTMQVVLGALTGLVIAGAGHWLYSKTPLQGSLLAGAGTAVTYFSIYAGYAVESYQEATGLSLAVAAVLLSLALAGAAWLAIRQHSATLLVETMLLAHITTLLAPYTWFTALYIILVVAAFSLLVTRTDWEDVGWFGGGITFFFALILIPQATLAQASVHILGLFAAFTYLATARKNALGQILTFVAAYVLGMIVASTTILDPAWFTLGAAVAAGLLYLLLQPRNQWYMLSAIALLAFWVPLELEGMLITGSWAVLALLIGWIGADRNDAPLRAAAGGIATLTLIKLIGVDSWELADAERLWTFLIVAAALLLLAWRHLQNERAEAPGYFAAAILSLIITIFIETAEPTTAILLALLAAAVCVLGERRAAARYTGLAVYAVLGAYILFAVFSLSGSERLISIIIPAALAFATSYRYAVKGYPSTHGLYMGGVAALFLLIGIEADRVFMTVLWGLLGVASYALGLQTERPVPKYTGLVVIGVTVAKLFLVDTLTLSPGLRIVVYLVLGALLLGGSILFAKRKQ